MCQKRREFELLARSAGHQRLDAVRGALLRGFALVDEGLHAERLDGLGGGVEKRSSTYDESGTARDSTVTPSTSSTFLYSSAPGSSTRSVAVKLNVRPSLTDAA